MMQRSLIRALCVVGVFGLVGSRLAVGSPPNDCTRWSFFGSEVRGDARPDSDIDVLAVLETLPGDYGDELERGRPAVYPVALKLGRRVSVKPVAREEYERGDSPLLREVRRSGIAA